MKWFFYISYLVYTLYRIYYNLYYEAYCDCIVAWQDKIWFLTMDLMLLAFSLILITHTYDLIIRKMSIVISGYQIFQTIFNLLWLSNLASNLSGIWAIISILVIIILTLIILSDG